MADSTDNKHAPERSAKRGYTIDDVVELGVFGRRSTVYKMIGTGKLRAKKVGDRTIILDEDIEAAIKELPAAEIKPPADKRTHQPPVE